MKKISFFFFLLLFCSVAFSQNLFDPKNSRVVIAGVLKWEDPSINTFSDHHRKDKELYEQFLTMGIPKENITLLIDEEATLTAMQDNIQAKMAEGDEKTTFIFYYAGHGVKEGKNFYFCNYDMKSDASTRFDVTFLNKTAAKKFKGKRVILLADCCYSGSLLKVGETISKTKKEVVVMSSATSSNISTGNWTFTQTLLDNFKGKSEGDRDKNGEITLKELSVEISDAMKYRERQLNGFTSFSVDASKVIVQKLAEGEKKSEKTQNSFTIDQYVLALTKGNWEPGRIKSLNADDITIEFYDYSDKREEIIHKKFVKQMQTPGFTGLTKIEVEWEKKFYKATVKKTEGDFYFIQYDGYDATWNEWVMYDRIKTGKEKDVLVEWNTTWYKGMILHEKEDQYFVTYKGYDRTWDEWVTKDRVK